MAEMTDEPPSLIVTVSSLESSLLLNFLDLWLLMVMVEFSVREWGGC